MAEGAACVKIILMGFGGDNGYQSPSNYNFVKNRYFLLAKRVRTIYKVRLYKITA